MSNRVDMRNLTFGVEVEVVKITREEAAWAVQQVVGGEIEHVGSPLCYDPWRVRDDRGRIWEIMADSSLSNVPKHLRAEVVSPILCYEDIPQLQEVVRSLRWCGAKVDSTCALHAHIGAERFDGQALARLARMYYKQEELILKALAVNENRLKKYCLPMRDELIEKLERRRPRTMDDFNRIWYGEFRSNPHRLDKSRYAGLNFNSVFTIGTLEWRIAEGTLHAGKVRAYVQFCLAMTAKALNGRAASSIRRTYDPESARYDMRVILLGLNFIGPEFKSARLHLLANMPGDSAFKRGRPGKKLVFL